MGELIALAGSTGKQLILETHSNHIINGIRVAVKEEKIDPRNIAILFLEKKITDSENFTRVDTILLDKNGSLSDYPDNFMDEWGNQLSKLI
jgi:predicted ATPase